MKILQYIFGVFLIITLSSFSELKQMYMKGDEVSKNLLAVGADTLLTLDDNLIVSDIENTEYEGEYEVVNEQTKASYYHDKFTGRKTASGEIFDNSKYTAAHKTLPFGTKIKVTNLKNQRFVVLTVTDRGPFTKGRSVDLSKKAFFELTDNHQRGVLEVKIEKLLVSEN
ncbi:septal ring lytic transglycosylase RlpA family protein [Myroides indicus]|uniref:Probable endolytic peptidoglycan transglycosylase RlpA n=1 Tax=Myroides indicus TaxID=1323422 RepID=A0A4R7ESV3_9FLAO|nr:septal ring lytic transglycosylase RlpA family protein [Myroides indicus]TDS56608.1 rare lipoprotein A [Myroides indicus]